MGKHVIYKMAGRRRSIGHYMFTATLGAGALLLFIIFIAMIVGG
jgi:hypothetical protein